MDRAVELLAGWARAQPIPDGATLEVVRLGEPHAGDLHRGPGTGGRRDDTVLLYGHLDKQPEMTGWARASGPWTPVIEGDKLYGRGGADDGYAVFASLTAIHLLQEQKRPHARCVVLIEACEESGSYDLPAYIEHLAPRIGTPSLVVCLDSGCGNYEQLWCTTSLRGGDRHARGERAARGRALGRRQRHRALELPHPARSCSTASRTSRHGAILPPSCTSRSRRRVEQAKRPPRCSATSLGQVPVPRA